MKITLIALVFMILATGLVAQTGMFGLSFGDSYHKCASILQKEGFKLDGEPANNEYTFESSANEDIDSIILKMQPGADRLNGWTIAFNIFGDEYETEDMVFELVIDLHGDDYEYDDTMETYTWSLGNKRFVDVTWGWLYDMLYVDYHQD